MVQVTNSDTMQELIQQAEKRGLLDAIDGLRRLGLGNSIDLPQLIVVGNQCDAKTSVLEAIAGVRLTTRDYYDNSGTRFVTELVLRTSSTSKVGVEIHTGNLLAFGQVSLDKHDLPRIIHEAKRFWTIGHGSKTPSSEAIMRLDISGPDVPQLTLIDLPGFQQQPSAQESLDLEVTERYMSQESSIILAVFQAQDKSQAEHVSAQGRVVLKAGQHDPSRCRTLGIITEPENVEEGSTSEQKHVLLALNKSPIFRLARGYHVLCTRGRKENDLSKADQDQAERAYFRRPGSAWSTIPAEDRGVDALREKLGRILAAHIQEKLPYLIASIEKLAKQREQDLVYLGGPRVSIRDQRKYLTTLTGHFHDLAADAIRGNYSDGSFFGAMFDNGNAPTPITNKTDSQPAAGNRLRKLRSLIRDANRAFHFVMSTNGARRQIIWPEGGHHNNCTHTPVLQDDKQPEPPKHLQPFIAAYQDCNEDTAKLKLSNLEGELSQGIISDDLALRLFLDQAQPWEAIAMRHLEIVLKIARRFTEELVTYLSHPVTGNGGHREAGSNATAEILTRAYIDPYFERRKQLMAAKLAELLRPYQGKGGYRGNLGGGSGEFSTKVQDLKTKKAGVRPHRCCSHMFMSGMGKNALRKDGGSDETKEVVLNMQVYYDMSLSTFVDNVKLLAIENCLINDIPNILTPEMVLDMSDDMVQRVGTESPQVERTREDLRNQLDKLHKGLDICQKYRPWHSAGLSHLFSEGSVNQEDLPDTQAKDNKQTTSPTSPALARRHCGLGPQVDTKTQTNHVQFASPEVLAELTASPVKMFQGPFGTKLRENESPTDVLPNKQEPTQPNHNPFNMQPNPQPQVYHPYHPLAVQPLPTRKNPPVKRMTLLGKLQPADTWNDAGFFIQPAHVPTHAPIKPLTKATTFGPRPFHVSQTANAPFHVVAFNAGGCFTPYNSNATSCGTINSHKDDGVPVLPRDLLDSQGFSPAVQYPPTHPHPNLFPLTDCLKTIRPGITDNPCPYPTDNNTANNNLNTYENRPAYLKTIRPGINDLTFLPYPTDNDNPTTDDSIVALKTWHPLGGGVTTTANDKNYYEETDVAFWNQAQYLSAGEKKWSFEEIDGGMDCHYGDGDGTTAANSVVGEGDGDGEVLVIE